MSEDMVPCTHPGVSCAEIRRRVEALLDGECDPVESRELESMIEACPQCMEGLGQDATIRRLLRRCCSEQAPAELRTRITTRIRVTWTRAEFRG
ncbi:mycothiol system anti-sigma-R factor [Corynebacterium sphenisci]|uniref:mycothiol system anti-sigma-R factor n=1 Tax=Corynebacterium sphenisci TaxID=191493 RepID=UPI0026DEE687|nr:mycothiol system anti-sigma-R factor [Corynebacterium sphenisci]MDO5730620.1 mycothiol system anti-sigma-R factor [Corynebacterium sphenisci]